MAAGANVQGASPVRSAAVTAAQGEQGGRSVSPGLALRLIWASFWYRVRKREANNLVVTFTLMVAFQMAWWEVAYRGLFAALLNCLAYLLNDYCDIDEDLLSPLKHGPQVQRLDRHRGSARFALFGLGAALVLLAAGHALLLGPPAGAQRFILFFVLASAATVVYLYSRWLKRIPVADLLAMGVAGAAGTLTGLPALDRLGLELLVLLALFCSSYEMIQVIRDEPADRARQVRTSAVVLGVRATAWIFRATTVGAAAFGTLVLGSPLCLACAAAAAVPLTPERAARSWDLVRIFLGLVWLGLMLQVFLGHLHA
jgi:4-hydroxybenzoate polyprenyltransferase